MGGQVWVGLRGGLVKTKRGTVEAADRKQQVLFNLFKKFFFNFFEHIKKTILNNCDPLIYRKNH